MSALGRAVLVGVVCAAATFGVLVFLIVARVASELDRSETPEEAMMPFPLVSAPVESEKPAVAVVSAASRTLERIRRRAASFAAG